MSIMDCRFSGEEATSLMYSGRTRLVILWIYIAILRRSISRLPSADAYLHWWGTASIVAMVRAPVCPSLATPLSNYNFSLSWGSGLKHLTGCFASAVCVVAAAVE